MSSNDKFFDAFVREKLRQSDIGAPVHLWDSIRYQARRYFIRDRKKHLALMLFLLFTTAGIGYWAFHVIPAEELNAKVHPLPASDSAFNSAFNSTFLRDTPDAAAVAKPAPYTYSGVLLPKANVHALPVLSSPFVTVNNESAQASDQRGAAYATDANMGTIAYNGIPAATVHDAGEEVIAGEPETAPFIALHYPPLTANLVAASNVFMPSKMSSAFLAKPSPDAQLASVSFNKPIRVSPPPFKRRPYLEFYLSPDNVIRRFKDNNNTYGKYISERQTTERRYLSFSTGLQAAVPVLDRWWLKSGVNYSQINERLHYVNNNFQTTVPVITTRPVVRGPGDTVMVSDTTRVAASGKHVKQSLNTYRMLDIPVILGYDISPKDSKIQVTINGGAIFNLRSWYSGVILDTTYTPVVISSTKQAGISAWKNNLGATLYGSVGVTANLTTRMQVSVEPYFRYFLKPVNKDATVLAQEYRTTGIWFGLRYQLGKLRFAKN